MNHPIHIVFRLAASLLFTTAAAPVAGQSNSGASMFAPDQSITKVVVSGAVPDEASKSAILTKLHQVYGTTNVIDQIDVGGVVAPPNWSANVSGVLTPQIRSIRKGQLAINGTNIALAGEVSDERTRQSIATNFASILPNTYIVKDGLRVSVASQTLIDKVLANRVIEFEHASALLANSGKEILDELAEALKTVAAKRIDVIGHTDSIGLPARNLALSRARADSVKIYLVAKGLPAASIHVSGLGADQPLMSNATEEGRRRNRRIEFRIGQ
ncbi:OmpA family protein [Noviherbaspirillum saxi]|uniref:OmpA family protein n=1 Tax=Noviherbaspirillum saxi TaxID=2320863 RepID=A0A3A3G361_9BURK|nr:OmpA family protein [Noviherbaspirillum saxi]RJF95846.1 OmpA family protein [Noviherbaspirillum saxi]